MIGNCAAWAAYRAGGFADAADHYGVAAERSHTESDYELVRGLTGLGNAAAAAGNWQRAAKFWREADQLDVWLDARSVGEAVTRQALAMPHRADLTDRDSSQRRGRKHLALTHSTLRVGRQRASILVGRRRWRSPSATAGIRRIGSWSEWPC